MTIREKYKAMYGVPESWTEKIRQQCLAEMKDFYNMPIINNPMEIPAGSLVYNPNGMITASSEIAAIKRMGNPFSQDENFKLLYMRMRWDSLSFPPMDHISIHVKNPIAIVFVVHKGVPVTIEDDFNLFPSDNLITKLRLLIG